MTDFQTPSGAKIRYLGQNGYQGDRDYAESRGCVPGTEYTLLSLQIGDSSSTVQLMEKVGHFNSVMFENVEPITEENYSTEWTGQFEDDYGHEPLGATFPLAPVSWIGNVEEDPETGELMMTFPIELIEQMGWEVGTEMEWNVAENGEISLRKVADSDE